MYFANGSFTYFLSSNSHKIFSYSFLNLHRRIRKFAFKSFFFMLRQIKNFSFVSVLDLNPGKGAQYARSNGTSCRLIRFDEPTHAVLVKLPSGVRKLFSYYSFATMGQVSLFETIKYSNTKSGY